MNSFIFNIVIFLKHTVLFCINDAVQQVMLLPVGVVCCYLWVWSVRFWKLVDRTYTAYCIIFTQHKLSCYFCRKICYNSNKTQESWGNDYTSFLSRFLHQTPQIRKFRCPRCHATCHIIDRISQCCSLLDSFTNILYNERIDVGIEILFSQIFNNNFISDIWNAT